MRPTLFTLANLYFSAIEAFDSNQQTAGWMIVQHARTVDLRRHSGQGIPLALDWSMT